MPVLVVSPAAHWRATQFASDTSFIVATLRPLCDFDAVPGVGADTVDDASDVVVIIVEWSSSLQLAAFVVVVALLMPKKRQQPFSVCPQQAADAAKVAAADERAGCED